jgi:hypothetical protein
MILSVDNGKEKGGSYEGNGGSNSVNGSSSVDSPGSSNSVATLTSEDTSGGDSGGSRQIAASDIILFPARPGTIKRPRPSAPRPIHGIINNSYFSTL